MSILRIFRQTGIWLIISLLFSSLSLQEDSFLNAELIISKGKTIILQNGNVAVSVKGNEIWSVKDTHISDISVLGNDIAMLVGNRIRIYSHEGRMKGIIQLDNMYNGMERSSTGYYLYSETRGQLDLYLLNSGIYSHIADIDNVIGIQRDTEDNIIIHTHDGISRVARDGEMTMILDISCSDFAYDRDILYIQIDGLIYQYIDNELFNIASYGDYKPFTVKNKILYLLNNNELDSLMLP